MMKRYSLLLLGLMTALLLAGCTAQAAVPVQPLETMKPIISTPPDHTELSLGEPPSSASQEPSPDVEDGGYFDNTLFVGDSIMESIRQYVAAQRQQNEMLGTARFLTSTMGVSLADLVGERNLGIGFTYQGEAKPLENIVAEFAPRRVFLLLGLNGLAAAGPVVDDIVARYLRLISSLRAVCPETEFIVITNPPKVASRWLPDYTANRNFGNELIGQFVAALKQMCREQGVPFVDAYESLKDENDALPDHFCRDGYVHLNHQGAAVVVEALNAFAEGR